MKVLKSRLIVNGLRLLWTGLAVWHEHAIFLYSVHKCVWPDSEIQVPIESSPPPAHVLIVADPQILDHRSYPGRAPYLTYISQLLVDLNLRKSWRAALHMRPDVVVFLGDMMDGGRFTMSDDEYEEYFRRFKSIFPLDPRISQYFIPGNHDTGLGVSPQFSEKAAARYTSHFGPLNNRVSIANHTIVLLDAPSIVDAGHVQSVPGGPIEFVQAISNSEDPNPVVLFTHIPLSRPDGSSCGRNRERGTIRRGTGFGYQNTLGKSASDFLLDSLRPSVIFSGDDHDYCEYTHSFSSAGKSRHAREVTVKSFSMAMGIRRPGFQLLSLVPPHSMHGSLSHADSLCLLPDQLGIYLSTYIPLLVLSLIIICIANIHRTCFRQQVKRQYTPASTNSPSYAPLTGALRSRSDTGRPLDDWLQYPSDDDDTGTLPRPTPSASKKSARPIYSRSFVLFGRRRRITIGSDSVTALSGTIFSCCGNENVPKSRGFAAGFLYDVWTVAIYPLAIFAVLSWWMFR
ncbi:Metallo-dependent phosphatase-like protein [Mycena maculata]|uniref:Metallo-dependent phosphatase-like protein n=1 Tax=Mycena maculata TaxID=230809 RepID=A0AAD7KA89_9AGAR|nr:Metallo-dependent phosphatase-like protein [Mycena maculata]